MTGGTDDCKIPRMPFLNETTPCRKYHIVREQKKNNNQLLLKHTIPVRCCPKRCFKSLSVNCSSSQLLTYYYHPSFFHTVQLKISIKWSSEGWTCYVYYSTDSSSYVLDTHARLLENPRWSKYWNNYPRITGNYRFRDSHRSKATSPTTVVMMRRDIIALYIKTALEPGAFELWFPHWK